MLKNNVWLVLYELILGEKNMVLVVSVIVIFKFNYVSVDNSLVNLCWLMVKWGFLVVCLVWNFFICVLNVVSLVFCFGYELVVLYFLVNWI